MGRFFRLKTGKWILLGNGERCALWIRFRPLRPTCSSPHNHISPGCPPLPLRILPLLAESTYLASYAKSQVGSLDDASNIFALTIRQLCVKGRLLIRRKDRFEESMNTEAMSVPLLLSPFVLDAILAK